MIPVSADPKRFICALGSGGWNHIRRASTLLLSRCLTTRVISVLDASPTNAVQLLHHGPKRNLLLLSDSNPLSRKHSTSVKRIPVVPKVHHSLERNILLHIHSNVETKQDDDVDDDVVDLVGPRSAAWWTGKAPKHGLCPGVEADGRIYSLPQLTFTAASDSYSSSSVLIKKSLQDYFDNTWTMTEVLLASLQGEEAFQLPPYHDLRHPMIFYYGHPAALYVNKLRVAGLLDKPINPYYEVIFETGVDEMSWDDLSKNKMQWPSVAEVRDYRRQVYRAVSSLISGLTSEQCTSIGQDSPLWSLVLGFEHERIHLETSSVLINEMPLQYVRFPEGFPAYHPSVKRYNTAAAAAPEHHHHHHPVAGKHYPVNDFIDVDSQVVSIGKPRDFPSFGWDNEYGHREYSVPAFKATQFKVSNGEFLEFVKSGGYSNTEYWTDVGWKWRAFRNVKIPSFWVRTGPQGYHEYDLRVLFDTVPMQWDWPVVVNLHEAVAFTNWKSKASGKTIRVMTELEHRAIRGGTDDHSIAFGGVDMMSKMNYNTNLACGSMSPVAALAPNDKGFFDVFGNAWEWTLDYFCALPGFQVHPYYEDFSTPCFDGLHHIIQSGSFMSTGNEASFHSRFHFRPHFYQHASFRLVEQQDPSTAALITSDTDAPGPYVGSYPFRRSNRSMQDMMKQSAEQWRTAQQNITLLKHFNCHQHHDGVDMGGSAMQQLGRSILQQLRQSPFDFKWEAAHLLEVGCGPGGLLFSLAKDLHDAMDRDGGGGVGTKSISMIGIDHDAELISIAHQLLAGKTVTSALAAEGDMSSTVPISIPKIDGQLIDFRTADPMCLPAEMSNFDCVVLNDIIDKVSSPNSVLGRLGGARGLVRPGGGVLVICSTYQWKEETTPRGLWLGGYRDSNGIMVQSRDTLIDRLSPDFTLLASHPMSLTWATSEFEHTSRHYDVNFFVRK